MNLLVARTLAEELQSLLRPACQRIEIAGSVRRQKAEVHDIEIVAVPRMRPIRNLFGDTEQEESELNSLLDDLVSAERMTLHKGGERYKQFSLTDRISLDLFICLLPAQFGVIFALRTGPADYSKWLVTTRRNGGGLPSHLHVQDGGLYEGDRLVPTPEEQDFFRALELAWVEPAARVSPWRQTTKETKR